MGLLTPPSMVPRALVEGPARWAAWSVTWSGGAGWRSARGSARGQPRGRWLEVLPGCCDWDAGRGPTALGVRQWHWRVWKPWSERQLEQLWNAVMTVTLGCSSSLCGECSVVKISSKSLRESRLSRRTEQCHIGGRVEFPAQAKPRWKGQAHSCHSRDLGVSAGKPSRGALG